jgi:glycosyltransferase involved in cell wall biosynthesis
MKIAVYTIALNEEKFVERWYESAKDADYLLIADTGSTDKTKRIAKKLGIKVIDISVKPFRFDDARNAALAALPADIDYCISMDMDETLSKGWRKNLEKMTADRVLYVFNLSYRDEMEKHPEAKMINNRIHKRNGFRWKYLMHEVIVPSRTLAITEEFCEGLEVSHHPDQEKPRTQYNQMIEDSYLEYGNSRYASYHGLQLYSLGRFPEALKVFKEIYKDKKAHKSEQAHALRFSANCVKRMKRIYLYRSLFRFKTREAYSELALLNYNSQNWIRCIYFSLKALKIRDKISGGIFTSDMYWGYLPLNILKAAKHNVKLFKWSRSYKNKRRTVAIGSVIAHNFDMFKD